MNLGWTNQLLSDTREAVLQLLQAPPEPVEALVDQVLEQQSTIHRRARPLTDLALADALADATIGLLRTAGSGPSLELAAVAARYFARDPAKDLASAFGFDDDIEVFNAIASEVAPELVLGESW